jgi:uncharacterized protein YggE
MLEDNFVNKGGLGKLVYNIAIVCLLILFLAGSFYLFFMTRNSIREYKYIGRTPESIKTMNFAGEGKVNVKPDIAMISMGLSVEKKTVSDAQKESTKTMNSFMEKIKSLGIAESDIKTTNYNIYPQYDWYNGVQNLRGYQLNQNVEIKIRNLEKISEIVALAGEFNLNQVQDLRFDVDNKEEYLKNAKEEAIKKAKENATETAKLLGISLGRIVSYNEYENYPNVYNGYKLDYAYAEGLGGGASVPEVSAGNAEISVNVNIVYELN